MKGFIVLSSIVYSLSLSLPPQSSDYMSLYETPVTKSEISDDLDSGGTVQQELMGFYIDPEKYQMTPSVRIDNEAVYSDESESEVLEVFGVKIPVERGY